MSARGGSAHGLNKDGRHGSQAPDTLKSRHYLEKRSSYKSSKGDGNYDHLQDKEAMELHLRIRAQEHEIQSLREKVAAAGVKEMKLLTEKYKLEQKFSELRLVMDEQQNEGIIYSSNELAHRKGDIENNLKLIDELKDVENQRYIYMSSMLGLLAQHGFWPPAISASVISTYVKRLHDQLQRKVSQDNITGATEGNLSHINYGPGASPGQDHGISHYDAYEDKMRIEEANKLSKGHSQHAANVINSMFDGQMPQGDSKGFTFDFQRSSDKTAMMGPMSQPLDIRGPSTSSGPEEGPGIEGFQIIGEATPGQQLLGCGYPVRGTSLCMFQWVRHLEDGTTHYIEGATNPEYVVTADDVEKRISVECIPMDEIGRQVSFWLFMILGDIVKHFANDQNKIKCDPEMQAEIDMYISRGHAIFKVLLLVDSSEKWESATLTLRQPTYEIKISGSGAVVVAEKFSKEFSIRVPCGFSTQFVLTSSDGSSLPLSTHDARMRDTLVVTVRTFQNKALDEKRKGRA